MTSGPAQFLRSTFGYQLFQRGGGVQLSIWTYLPAGIGIAARLAMAAAAVLLALAPLARPPVQGTRGHAALAAALLIGSQLLLGYWFYSYLTWFYPLLVIALIQAPPDPQRDSRPVAGPAARQVPLPAGGAASRGAWGCPPGAGSASE